MARTAVSGLQQGLPSISVALQSEFRLTTSQLGAVLGAANVATAASVLLWGQWSDDAGDRRVLLTGLPLAAVALLAVAGAAAAQCLVPAMIALGCAGVGAAAGTAALSRALSDRLPPSVWGTVLGLRQAAVPVGGLAATLALPVAVGAAGTAAAFVALSTAMVAAAAAVVVGLPRTPRPGGAERDRGIDHHRSPPVPGLGRLLIANACYVVAQAGTVSLAVAAWFGVTGRSAPAAAALFALVQGSSVACRVAAHRLGDARPRLEPALMLALGVTSAALLAALSSARAVGAPGVVVAVLLLAACVPLSSWNGIAFTMSTRSTAGAGSPHRLGRIHGLQNTVLFAGVGLSPAVTGAVVMVAGWAVAWAILAVIAGLGALTLTGTINAASGPDPSPPAH